MEYIETKNHNPTASSCQLREQFTAKKCNFGKWVVLSKSIKERMLFKRVYVRCGQFNCPYCRELKKRKLARLIRKSCPKSDFSMLTLTLRRNSYDLKKNWFDLSRFWDILIKRLKRQYPGLKYFRVVELQKNGMPHIHALINFYSPKWYIQSVWKDITGDSFICRFEKIRTSCASYILKYFSKSIQDINYIRSITGKHTRIFNRSRNLFEIERKNPSWKLLSMTDSMYEASQELESYKQSSRLLYGRVGPITSVYDEYDMLSIFSFKSIECACD